MVERDLPKVDVASSSLVIRSTAKLQLSPTLAFPRTAAVRAIVARVSFTGFPNTALDFYDDLELDNTKSFWQANKAVYDEAVRAPMVALLEALAPAFAAEADATKVFRPYRDVRFARDKTPYKTHQGAFVRIGPATGWYVELSARGTRVGAGCYELSGERLARVRRAIDDEVQGSRLESLFAELAAAGFEIGGERLRTSPRGYGADHPRIDLLRHKQFLVSRDYGFDEAGIGPGLLGRVRADWQTARPLVEWLAER